MTHDGKRCAPEDFLEALCETLDIDRAIERLGITREQARAILKGYLRPYSKKSEKERKPCGGVAEGVFEVCVDGASRGNPGESGAGAVIKNHEGGVIKRLKKYLGTATNNEAEYQALIMALKEVHSMRIRRISVFADSELMVKQLKGEYKVKSQTLKPFYATAAGLLSNFEAFSITHIERERNKAADTLANEAIDQKSR
ncbi:MAG: ribonuclease HI family protein [Deltaproteobacteria bacterium]